MGRDWSHEDQRKAADLRADFCVRRGLESLFSTAVHGLLTREITRLSLLPIGDCLASLFSSRQHMMLYLCLQGFVCVLAVMFFLTNMRPYESDLDTITPEIKTPRAVGQYQHGSARWMSDAEKKKPLTALSWTRMTRPCGNC